MNQLGSTRLYSGRLYHCLLLSYPKPLPKATLGDRSFTYAAPKLRNALPLAIRSVNTVTDFKGKLKTYLFSKAFS